MGKLLETSKETKKKLAEKAARHKKETASLADPKYEFPPGWKVPKTLGIAADKLYETRAQRLALQRDAEALQAEETALKQHIIRALPKQDSNGIAGKLCRVSVSTKEVPRVEDWPTFYAGVVAEYNKHAKKHDGQQDGAFALLNRALGKAAVEEAWDAGKEVKGVGRFTVVDVSVNKL